MVEWGDVREALPKVRARVEYEQRPYSFEGWWAGEWWWWYRREGTWWVCVNWGTWEWWYWGGRTYDGQRWVVLELQEEMQQEPALAGVAIAVRWARGRERRQLRRPIPHAATRHEEQRM